MNQPDRPQGGLILEHLIKLGLNMTYAQFNQHYGSEGGITVIID